MKHIIQTATTTRDQEVCALCKKLTEEIVWIEIAGEEDSYCEECAEKLRGTGRIRT